MYLCNLSGTRFDSDFTNAMTIVWSLYNVNEISKCSAQHARYIRERFLQLFEYFCALGIRQFDRDSNAE